MDKLRALQYFIASAEAGSLSAAARNLGVSLAAVAKLVAALENDLGVVLFDRTSRGLQLTADGDAYLLACQPAVEQIATASEVVGSARDKPRGTVVVGASTQVARHCIVPGLAEFHARYPDVEVDLRDVSRLNEPAARSVEVFVLIGWPPPHDLASRRLSVLRSIVCAAPSYWAQYGIPGRPGELSQHICFPFRNPDDVLLDHWRFKRGEEEEQVTVRSWLAGNDREALLDVVLAGGGAMRLADLTALEHLRGGRLLPVLTDWQMLDNPPITLLYRQNHRRIPRLRVFVDFVVAQFDKLQKEADRGGALPRLDALPRWHRRSSLRASMIFKPSL